MGEPTGDKLVKSAPRDMLEELFQDSYRHRYRVYRMNFFRGIFFGFGSALGTTVVVALLLWTLSWFNNVPLIGNFIRTVQHSIEISQKK